MIAALEGQKYFIGAIAAYKKWKKDHNLTNKDTYETLREQFRKDDLMSSIIIDIILSK